MLGLVSLFEGRHDTSIQERVASLLPLEVAKETVRRSFESFMRDHGGRYTEDAFLARFRTRKEDIWPFSSLGCALDATAHGAGRA